MQVNLGASHMQVKHTGQTEVNNGFKIMSRMKTYTLRPRVNAERDHIVLWTYFLPVSQTLIRTVISLCPSYQYINT